MKKGSEQFSCNHPASDRHFYDVITNGHGVMASYANRVEPEDRWAIVAYIRALQRSQWAAQSDVPAGILSQLRTRPREAR